VLGSKNSHRQGREWRAEHENDQYDQCELVEGDIDIVYVDVHRAGLAQWWPADVTESGGAVELGFFNRQTVYRVRPQFNQPSSHFEWACGALVRFTHAAWESATDYFVSCTTTWGELMFRLKSAAEGKSRGPLFLPASLAY
jgi:hypothetical protein